MDTSKEFILQCEKAVEIQKLAPTANSNDWEFDDKQGSVFWLPKDKEFALWHWDNDEGHLMIGGYCSNLGNMVWLPRQDQLQDMLDNPPQDHNFFDGQPRYSRVEALVYTMFDFTNYNSADSMEQLWLAFVMKAKYNKIWDWEGKEWKIK